MTESIENPGSFSVPGRRTFLGLWGPARTEAPESAEDKILWLQERAGHFRRIIYGCIAERYVADVWQTALLAMTEHLKRGNQVENLSAYMATVCRNCARDELERIRRRAELLIDDTEVLQDRGVLLDDSGLDYEEVKKVLEEVLTPLEHKVYVLRHVYDLPSRQIGALLGSSAASVRQTIRRAHRKVNTPEVKARFIYRLRLPEQ